MNWWRIYYHSEHARGLSRLSCVELLLFVGWMLLVASIVGLLWLRHSWGKADDSHIMGDNVCRILCLLVMAAGMCILTIAFFEWFKQ